jgi:spore coat protein U-like protein
MKTKQNALVLGLAISAFFAFSSAYAGDATSSLPVSASVSANCTIDATGGLAFGAYDPVGANSSAGTDLDQQGTINTVCTTGASATITLGQGLNADAASTADVPVRRMLSGTTDYLSYELYSDAARTATWGDTTPTGAPVTGTGTSVATTVYGRIVKGQNVPASLNYADTVVATVTF